MGQASSIGNCAPVWQQRLRKPTLQRHHNEVPLCVPHLEVSRMPGPVCGAQDIRTARARLGVMVVTVVVL
jgi:hypothetical protein